MTVLALCQINPTVGDLDGNVERILSAYRRAADQGAQLVLAPEMAICGYPAKDLLLSPAFLDDCRAAVDKVSEGTGEATLVFGAALPNEGVSDKPAYNVAVIAQRGKLVGSREKSLLPTYDVFDERRYFAPAPRRAPIKAGGVRLGVTICEDIWRLEFWPTPEVHEKAGKRPYGVDPIDELRHAGIDMMVNLSASPYARGKRSARLEVVSESARDLGRPVAYCNQVGGNDSLIFDGASFVVDAKGRIVAQAKAWEEDLIFWDSQTETDPVAPVVDGDPIADMLAALELGLRDYARKCGFREVVIGLSGGVDSALTAAMAARALGPENVHGVAMPSRYSSPGSLADAQALAKALGIDYRVIPIEEPFKAFLGGLAPSFEGRQPDVTEENLQARIRGTLLMSLSNKFGWLVLSTGNKSETAVGYSTLYGDSCGGLAVIADVPKVDVYKLSRHINKIEGREIIPESTLSKAPSAELRPDQKDQDSLPPYEVLDPILECYIERSMSSERIAEASGPGYLTAAPSGA
jgi:NAD+ synthase (glutamine-hydrolysing)